MNTHEVRHVWQHGYSAGWLAAQQELQAEQERSRRQRLWDRLTRSIRESTR